MYADVVENADMWMLEGGTGSSFADHLGRVPDDAVIMKNLYSDGATQLDVSGPVDVAHAARPKQGVNLITADTFAGNETHEIRDCNRRVPRPTRWSEEQQNYLINKRARGLKNATGG